MKTKENICLKKEKKKKRRRKRRKKRKKNSNKKKKKKNFYFRFFSAPSPSLFFLLTISMGSVRPSSCAPSPPPRQPSPASTPRPYSLTHTRGEHTHGAGKDTAADEDRDVVAAWLEQLGGRRVDGLRLCGVLWWVGDVGSAWLSSWSDDSSEECVVSGDAVSHAVFSWIVFAVGEEQQVGFGAVFLLLLFCFPRRWDGSDVSCRRCAPSRENLNGSSSITSCDGTAVVLVLTNVTIRCLP